MTRDRDDLTKLKAALDARVLELGEALFGQPTTRNAGELRWGRKGSIRITLTGKNGPSFYNFEAGAGGSLLDAIVFANACSFPEAVEWARRWLGEDDRPTPRPRFKPKPIDVDKLEAQRIADARRMFAESRPIPGTPGEVYLRGVRGIAADAWPADLVRYHPRLGVIVAATTADGTLTAVQRVEIEADGKPRRDEDGHKVKRTRGVLAGTAVRFRPVITAIDGPLIDGPLLLAEGPETAASCWWATGFETWANLGSIARAPLASVPTSRLVVVCRDDDPAKAPSRKALRDAVKAWRAEGRTVVEATPWALSRGDKSDFNDLLVAEGRDAVRQRILAAIGTDGPPRPKKPSLIEATGAAARVIGETIDELVRWVSPAEDVEAPAPFKAIKVATGIPRV